jgi:hypothetical protein
MAQIEAIFFRPLKVLEYQLIDSPAACKSA